VIVQPATRLHLGVGVVVLAQVHTELAAAERVEDGDRPVAGGRLLACVHCEDVSP